MPMYNLLEYSYNYKDTSGSLYQFKRDESPMNNARNLINISLNNSSSFKYKSNILGKRVNVNNNGVLRDAKIVVPLKYVSNSFRSLEMPLINCKIHSELNWIKDCVMCGSNGNDADDDVNNDTTFKTTSTTLYAPIVTLST